MQREEKIWLVFFQREEYWCDMGSRRETRTQRLTPLHPSTTFSQWRKAWLRSSAPTSTSTAWWVATAALLTGGCSSTCFPTPAPNRCSTFLEEEDHRREERVANSRMRFWKLSRGREDGGYKGNTQTFWKILLSRREFQFLTFQKEIEIPYF